ncbi:MAG: hypothetical protein MI700_10450 [Balneolales bacterium]|nr:hypothetical protein [Balneolales bacterium]
MSIIIADAGATVTNWAIVSGFHEQIVKTSGINPVLKVDAEIEATIFDELLPQIDSNEVKEVFFYGAGCKDWNQAERVQKLLNEAFRKKQVTVKTDIEGAGIALYGKGTGIVAIAGTGSSAGFMDRGQLVDIMPSKAYPEGDFAAGAQIGARILKDVFVGEAPESIKGIIEENRKLSVNELFLRFQDPNKSKLIASKVLADIATSPGFKDPDHDQYLRAIVQTSLDKLFNLMKAHFKNALAVQPIRFVGSTVFTFEEYFREYFKRKSILIDDIQRNPIRGLVHHHQNEL